MNRPMCTENINPRNYSSNMKRYLLIVAILIIFQTVFTLTIFPIHRLDLKKPLLYADHAIHLHQTRQTLDLLKTSGRTWGYDPYFMAGYPTAIANNIDNFGAAFTTGILSVFMPLAVANKVFLLMMLILLPIIMFSSCRNFSFGVSESFLSGLILIQVFNAFWYYKFFVTLGMYSFVFGGVLALLVFSLFYRYLKRGERWALICYVLSGSYALTIHPLSTVILLCFVIFYFTFDFKELRSPKIKYLLLGSLVIVAVNLYWIIPLIRFSKYYLVIRPSMQALGCDYFVKYITELKNRVFNILVLCSLLTPLFLIRKNKDRSVIISIWVVFLLMYVASFFATGSIFAHIEPRRFIVISGVLTPVFMAHILSRIFASRIRFVTVLLCLALSGQTWPCFNYLPRRSKARFIQRIFCSNLHGTARIASDVMDKGGQGLVDKILELTDDSARILIEDSKPVLSRRYWGSHFPAILPYLTNREFIGGPYHGIKVKHSFASFFNGEIFSRPINDIEIDRFMEYMDLYNIKWVFTQHQAPKQYFQSHPGYFRYVSSYQYIDIYQVNRDASYFLKGTGKISASLDKIKLTHVSKGDIIIKYHYLETLKTEPPLKIERFNAMDDPIGFIKINNEKGFETITIYN